MNKLSSDYQYISLINMLGHHLQKAYKINDKDLQKLKNDIHKIISEVVEND